LEEAQEHLRKRFAEAKIQAEQTFSQSTMGTMNSMPTSQWRPVPPAGQTAQFLALEEQVAAVIANTQSKVEKMDQIIRSRSPSPRESLGETVGQTSDYQQQRRQEQQQWQQEHYYQQLQPDVRDELQPTEVRTSALGPTNHDRRLEQRLKELEQEVERLSRSPELAATVAGAGTGHIVGVADRAQRPPRRSVLSQLLLQEQSPPPAKTLAQTPPPPPPASSRPSPRQHNDLDHMSSGPSPQQWSNVDTSKRAEAAAKRQRQKEYAASLRQRNRKSNQRQRRTSPQLHGSPTPHNSSTSPGMQPRTSMSYQVDSSTPLAGASSPSPSPSMTTTLSMHYEVDRSADDVRIDVEDIDRSMERIMAAAVAARGRLSS
jgi:hypothetical protein